MTYREVLEYLDARPPRGERRGLERMRLLMHKLGDPQRSLRFVHIAGTSGKGSTAAMTERMLRACGYRTGLFVSPHTFDFRERIQLDGVMADKALLAETLTEMRPALDALDAMGDPAAAFETMTALALCVFAKEKPDLVVLEVGIGGLLDSTNIIDLPEVAAVCAISIEHTNLLGKTIPEIAAQKCGIIKPGCRAVGYCALPPEAQTVFLETCRRCGVTPEIPMLSQVQLRSETDQGSRFVWRGREWFVPLAGLHQVKNALTALAILHQLQAAGYDLPENVPVFLFVGRLAFPNVSFREGCRWFGESRPVCWTALTTPASWRQCVRRWIGFIPKGRLLLSWALWRERTIGAAFPWWHGGAEPLSQWTRSRAPGWPCRRSSWPGRRRPSARRCASVPMPKQARRRRWRWPGRTM